MLRVSAGPGQHFGIDKIFRTSTEVTSWEEVDAACSQWRIRFRTGGGQEEEMVVDGVVYSGGQTNVPFTPTHYEGQDTFQGTQCHSSEYRGQAPYLNKRVLVVGLGAASGSDIAQDCSFGAKQVYVSTRRGVIYVPRFVAGHPSGDWFSKKFWDYIPFLGSRGPGWMDTVQNIGLKFSAGTPEERGLKTDFDPFTQPVGDGEERHIPEMAFQLGMTDSNNLMQRIAMGAIKIKPSVKRFTPTGVVFEDGTEAEVDAVVWATGYHRGIGAKGKAVRNESPPKLFRYIFPPNRPGLAYTLAVHPKGPQWALADAQGAHRFGLHGPNRAAGREGNGGAGDPDPPTHGSLHGDARG